MEQTSQNPIQNSMTEAYETLLYQTKGVMRMHCGFLSKENAYFVVLRPWKDVGSFREYLELHLNNEKLPVNVAVFVSDDPQELSSLIKAYKYTPKKYARNRRKKKSEERHSEDAG